MVQSRLSLEGPQTDLQPHAAASKATIAPPKQRRRYLSPFWRHFVEMNLAMWAGMGLGALLFIPLFAWVGTSRSEFRIHHPAAALLLMGFEMIAAMVAWMRYRGHDWRGCVEMAVAMLVPAIPLVACLQADVLSVGAAYGLYMAAMPLAMLALMLYRRPEYSMPM